jgi:Putative Ig domain
MAQQWVTPAGSLANLLIGVPVSIQLEAFDTLGQSVVPIYSVSGTGTLPPGLTLSNSGVISGTPAYSTPSNNYWTTQTYNFTVRLTSTDGAQSVDEAGRPQPYRTFSIIITNVVNNNFNWITAAGDLGTVPNGEFYSLRLQAETSSSESITYSFLSGELPPGMEIIPTGYLQGVPTFLNPVGVNQSETYRFTIRATTASGHVNDRSFALTLTNVYNPIITPNSPLDRVSLIDPVTKLPTGQSILSDYPPGVVTLGAAFDGTYFSQQLEVFELNPNVQIEWMLKEGDLPLGLTLSSTGLISGYIQPLQLTGAFGPPGYDGDRVVDTVIVEQEEFGSSPYDFNQLNQSLNYKFAIQAYDGANYSVQKYILQVVSRSDFTADSTVLLNNTQLTVDSGKTYIPLLLNDSSNPLPEGRQDSYYAYKFNGIDFGGDQLTYSIVNIIGAFDTYVNGVDAGFDYHGDDVTHAGGVGFDSYNARVAGIGNLPGLALDPQTGWLYGKLLPQSLALQMYEFGIQVSKTVDGVTYFSQAKYFKLPVLGNINNTVNWTTPKNMGTIDNGSVSDLSIKAVSSREQPIVYSIYDVAGFPAGLPQGLQLMPSGAISGRVSFEAFSLDGYATTFDNNLLTVDRTYTFTALATTLDGTASSYQEFNLTINVVDQKPYVNLYLQAAPNMPQRSKYHAIVNNTEIFSADLIYRADDPWFGVNQKINMLFLPGLNSVSLAEYRQAAELNHWNKTYTFGSVKTAVVLDNNYLVKYEVVYVEVVDPGENTQGQGPGLEINLSGVIANPYVDDHGNNFYTIYPNSSQNMIKRLVNNVGYYDQSSLPPWMTSNQPSATTGIFDAPLGYTPAVVLAYTVPGGGQEIAYRLKAAGVDFGEIEFSTDRYYVDNFYSTNFHANSWIGGAETTFDTLPKTNIGSIVAQVTYGVTAEFDQINGRTVDYVNSRGGIDGITTFQSGDTLIFIQQENFLNPGPYDGWVDYTDTIANGVTGRGGYSNEPFDSYTVVPGYLESAHNPAVVNQRGGVWQIDIVDNIIMLSFVQSILLNDRVQILNGKNYKSSIFYYNSILGAGHSVPYYTIFNISSLKAVTTTFNSGTTRFFSRRDHYYTPESQDQILKFPQATAFN